MGFPGFEPTSTQAQPSHHAPIQKPAIPRDQTDPSDPQDPGVANVGGENDPIGERCDARQRGSDPDNEDGELCLSTKYVVFGSDNAAESDDALAAVDAASILQEINEVWRECDVQFQFDEFEIVDPTAFNIRYRIANYEELNQVRRAFADDDSLLVVATGPWNRRGSLGNSWANAWTNTPGSLLYGVVMEAAVASNSNLISHELGHYLNLDHVNDSSSLMNPIVSQRSHRLEQSQCEEARHAARKHWRKMMR